MCVRGWVGVREWVCAQAQVFEKTRHVCLVIHTHVGIGRGKQADAWGVTIAVAPVLAVVKLYGAQCTRVARAKCAHTHLILVLVLVIVPFPCRTLSILVVVVLGVQTRCVHTRRVSGKQNTETSIR